jgi:DNA gyrase subunit A
MWHTGSTCSALGDALSTDGDPAAAYRYTECTLYTVSEDLRKDIDEDTVGFVPNDKESTTEASVLLAPLPNLLMNGSTGIAVGMATNIQPRNPGELIDASCEIVDDPQISVEELCAVIRGPDFPTGDIVVGTESMRRYLATGRGIVKMCGLV